MCSGWRANNKTTHIWQEQIAFFQKTENSSSPTDFTAERSRKLKTQTHDPQKANKNKMIFWAKACLGPREEGWMVRRNHWVLTFILIVQSRGSGCTSGTWKPDRRHFHAALCAVITVSLNKQHEAAAELNLRLTLFAGLLAGFGLIVTHFSISTQFSHPAPIC